MKIQEFRQMIAGADRSLVEKALSRWRKRKRR